MPDIVQRVSESLRQMTGAASMTLFTVDREIFGR
jgi:hypothetical protein